MGADIEKVRLGIGSDPRIGYHFIYPGCGYGGSCFPKDVQALSRSARDHQFDALLLNAVESVNKRQKSVLFDKLNRHFKSDLANKTIAVWGLAFKPNTDDMREAPSRALLESLWQAGARVQAYDPVAHEEAQRIYGERAELKLAKSAMDAVNGADALAIVTEWQEFRSPDFEGLKSQLRQPVIFDGRNLYDPGFVKRFGLQYYAIGRGDSVARPA
jgi:UDPglucose 6-dehydrogenase